MSVRRSLGNLLENLSIRDQPEEGPLKLVYIVETDSVVDHPKLQVDTKVLERVLNTCQGRRVAVLSVVGAARTGKSFLLNHIKAYLKSLENDTGSDWLDCANQDKGFQWAHGLQKVTAGIWVWSRAFLVTEDEGEIAVILIDSEGFDDEFPSQGVAENILGLALLASSTTIFNFLAEIDDSLLDLLAYYCKYAKHFSRECKSKAFGQISFLIRDWTPTEATLAKSFGNDAAQKVLESKLKKEKFKNLSLPKSFENFHCFVLPNIGETARKIGFSGMKKEMSRPFCQQLRSFVECIASTRSLTGKKVFDTDILPMEYGKFFLGYVEALNSIQKTTTFASELLGKTYTIALDIKHAKGLEEYTEFIKQECRKSHGNYIADDALDGLNILAQTQASSKFNSFHVPNIDSRNSELEFRGRLDEHFENFKVDNSRVRAQYMSECMKGALDSFKRQMLANFSFDDEDNYNGENFFDSDMMKSQLQSISKQTLKSLLEMFPTEPEEVHETLVSEAKEKISEDVESHLKQNRRNRELAKKVAKEVTQNLLIKYKNKLTNFTQNTDTTLSVLQILHEMQLEEIRNEYNVTQLHEMLREEYWNQLINQIEKCFTESRLIIENTTNAFERKLELECARYPTILMDQLELNKEFSTEDFKLFHQNSSKDIIERVLNNCPYKENSLQRKKIVDSLSSRLDLAFQVFLRDSSITDKILQEQATVFVQTSIETYEKSMKSHLEDFQLYVEVEKFDEFHTSCQEISVSEFLSNIDSVGEMKNAIRNESKAELLKKIEEKFMTYQRNNKLALASAKRKADTVVTQCIGDLMNELIAAGNEEPSIESIQAVFEEAKQKAFISFRENFDTLNEEFRHKYILKINSEAETALRRAATNFNQRMEAENFALHKANFLAENIYREKMTQKFSANQNAPFPDKELKKLHNQFKTVAIQKSQEGLQLTEVQKQKLEEHLENLLSEWEEKNEVNKTSYSNVDPAIGIDLGTTYCCAAVFLEGKIQIIPSKLGERTTPSYVTLNANGTAHSVGTTSKDLAFRHPESTIFDAKRIIGQTIDSASIKEDLKYFPFEVTFENGLPKICIVDMTIEPEKISAELLNQIKEDAMAYIGVPIQKAVITVPAHFTDRQRQATLRAGEIAGFKVLGILNEPSAAALAYRESHNVSENVKKILVYDLGGGTFDVAVLEMNRKNLRVLSVNGHGHLGGEDFDKNLVRHCCKEFTRRFKEDLFNLLESDVATDKLDAQRKLRRLQGACEKVKIHLSTAASATVSIDGFHKGDDFIYEISKKTFEDINKDLFQKTINIVNATLTSANVKNEDIDEVVMVGGSSRVPKLRELLMTNFKGKAINRRMNDDESIAQGAAIQAAMLNANPCRPIFDFERICEVTACSVGIADANGIFHPIIKKNSEIPISKKHTYSTSKDNQKTVKICIFEGENTSANENVLIANFTLDDIPNGKAGDQQVEISMTVNMNGILEVGAVCISTMQSTKIVVDSRQTVTQSAEVFQLPEAE